MPSILLNGQEVNFEKKYSSRAKNISISISKGANIILTIPKPGFFSNKSIIEKKAIDFLNEKSDWILKHISNGSDIKQINYDLSCDSREHYLKYRDKSRSFCELKCKYWSNIMGLSYNRISIKSMKTKWGSCSSKKNLNFNYKILFLSSDDQDYLIVHELSHLRYMNHSGDFWDLVCKTLGSEVYRKYKINS